MKRLAHASILSTLPTRKLRLNKEVVRSLGERELRQVAGGGFTDSTASDCLLVICPPYQP